jgi:hypothetical protein
MSRVSHVLVIAVLLSAPTLMAADDSKLAGHWEGAIEVAGTSLGVNFHVEANGSGLKAKMDVPDQGSLNLPVDEIKVGGGTVKLSLKRLRASYEGKLNAAQTEVAGKWTQNGLVNPLNLKKTAKPKTLTISDDLKGLWEGKLQVGGSRIRFGLRIETRPDGTRTVGFSSPDQGAPFLPINAISLVDSTVKLESKVIAATFQGKLNAAKTEIEGTFVQRGAVVPLTLKRTDKITEPARPQTPKAPFAYQSFDVTYPNESAKLTLAGTLTVPQGNGPFPAVIMISGSGPQDRDETLMGHKPFWVIADALTRRGIAVLRFDDRGVGKSTGNHGLATSADFATDVNAGITFLKTRKEINTKAIGLAGHSEGGLIAPMVAAENHDVAFIVMLAGPALNGAKILKAQNRDAVDATGLSETYLKAQEEILEKVYEATLKSKTPKEAMATLGASITPPKGMNVAETKRFEAFTGKGLEALVAQLSLPWMKFFLVYEPTTNIKKVTCPVLALNGERDVQVLAKKHLPVIESTLKSAGNTKVTTRELAGLNHLFQHAKTGAVSEYAAIEETVDPEVLKLVSDWILANTRK